LDFSRKRRLPSVPTARGSSTLGSDWKGLDFLERPPNRSGIASRAVAMKRFPARVMRDGDYLAYHANFFAAPKKFVNAARTYRFRSAGRCVSKITSVLSLPRASHRLRPFRNIFSAGDMPVCSGCESEGFPRFAHPLGCVEGSQFSQKYNPLRILRE
jgi:hypothetical protein